MTVRALSDLLSRLSNARHGNEAQDLRDGIESATGQGARLVQTSAQSIAPSSFTVVTWDTTPVFDDLGYFSAGTPTRLTAPTDGLYLVGGGVRIVGVDSGTFRLITRLRVNGTDVAPSPEMTYTKPAADTAFPGATVASLLRLSASQFVELAAFQTEGNARDSSPGQCGLWIVRLSG